MDNVVAFKQKGINSWGKHTIDNMILMMQTFKKAGYPGDTPIYLSDVEFNGKHKEFEVGEVENEPGLYIFFEMNDELWD